MEIKQAKVFIAVAEELHFGRAAERLHMAQPALSAQIKHLEAELGLKLLSRTTRRVALTRAGEAFLPEAKATVAQAEAAVAAARAMSGDYDLLKIGGIDSATAGILPKMVRRFKNQNSNIAIRIFEMLSAPALHGLANRSLDIAFTRIPPKQQYLQSKFVFREPILAALPIDHPYAADETVCAKALANEPLVIPSRSHRPILFDVIHGYLRSHGNEPNIRQEANERHMIISMVAAGLGISLVPAWVSQFKRDDVVYKALADGGPCVDVFIAWRKEDPMEAVHEFVGCVMEID